MSKTVDPRTAHQQMAEPDTAYVDVRTVEEFAEGHPAGAWNIPAFVRAGGGMAPNPRFVACVQAHFPPNTRLLLGCASGQRSAHAQQLLLQCGYTDVANVVGGFNGSGFLFTRQRGWRDEGLPVATDAGERAYEKLL